MKSNKKVETKKTPSKIEEPMMKKGGDVKTKMKKGGEIKKMGGKS
jgi:hypothetical protein